MARGRYIERRKDGDWRFVARVPTDLVSAYGEARVRVSLHTSEEVVALEKAAVMIEEYRQAWNDLRDGRSSDAKVRYDSAKRIARRHGRDYRSAADLAAAATASTAAMDELISRIRSATPETAPALLGTVPEPTLLLSNLVSEVERLRRVELSGKSPKQLHRWRIARERAVRNLIGIAGDISALDISRTVALDFADWWRDRLLNDGLKPASMNRDLENLGGLIAAVAKARRIENPKPFSGLAVPVGIVSRPHAITREDLIDHLIPALSRLNVEARGIVCVLIQTGLRPSEACNARPEDIVLECTVPHILIQRRDDRELKTINAVRRIPLVGIALEAARTHPAGWPRYHDAEATFCATVGKWMNEVMPKGSPRCSAYGLRHGFQDRLNDAAPPERVNADLMGHKISRERYGAGPSLDQLIKVMRAVSVA